MRYQPALLLLHLFNGLFSRTTWLSRHQKGRPFWILLKQEMMGWQGHQLDHIQSFAPRSRQITMPAPHHSVFTGWMPFLPLNQLPKCKISALKWQNLKQTTNHNHQTHALAQENLWDLAEWGFYGQMSFMPSNHQRLSSEGNTKH